MGLDLPFGLTIDFSATGETIIIGNRYDDNSANQQGSARVYTYVNNQWMQTAHNQGPWEHHQFGSYLDMNAAADRITIESDNGHAKRGAVRSFKNIGGNWYKTYPEIFGENPGDRLGKALVMSDLGSRIAFIAKAPSETGFDKIVRTYDYESPPLTVNEFEKSAFTLYPNPVSHQLHISNPNLESISGIKIYSVLGVSVLKEVKEIVGQSTISIDVSELSSAMHFVQINTEDKLYSETFIKK